MLCNTCHYGLAITPDGRCHTCEYWRTMFDDSDHDCVGQMEAVATMLEAAKPYGLEVEVVREAMLLMADGHTWAEACAGALVEWDL